MNDNHVKQKMNEFFKKHSLCVVSTIHADGKGPESALVAFAELDDLKIIFGTSCNSRKYKNIQENSHVSFVVGWDGEVGTLQYEGVATEASPEEFEAFAKLQVKKNPGSQKFVARDDQRYFVVTPTWIRFIDNAGDPPETYEITF
jgi:pyridoxine/pyridoxamine 5'-phosphate oxidase